MPAQNGHIKQARQPGTGSSWKRTEEAAAAAAASVWQEVASRTNRGLNGSLVSKMGSEEQEIVGRRIQTFNKCVGCAFFLLLLTLSLELLPPPR